jgi:DNA-binding transcriptional LysR family regulator
LLDAYIPHDATEPVHAVYVGHAGKMAARVRAFLDWIAQAITLP